ncbi:hypothetical protein MLIT_16480 [Mycolicibacterium litorale]|uniref:Uncharacterized protein n=1 Tax=Mycolicibacterium litorale TaxID=758802 RepID=A0AAD1IJG8_9MYCO|nr:hypothetical protein MLIT_16480 [Mycolicibacterium litorale]
MTEVTFGADGRGGGAAFGEVSAGWGAAEVDDEGDGGDGGEGWPRGGGSAPHWTSVAAATATASAVAGRRLVRRRNRMEDRLISGADATRQSDGDGHPAGRINARVSTLRYCQGAITEEEVSAAAVMN